MDPSPKLTVPEYTIRTAKAVDAGAIRALALAASIDAWLVADYAIEADRRGSIFLVVEKSSQINGFLLARLCPGVSEGVDAELFNIAVQPDLQGHGVASQLFDHFVNYCRDEIVEWVWLEVRSGNEKALRFYRKIGFSVFDTRKGFYTNPIDDALVMGLQLKSTPAPLRKPAR